MPIYIFKHPKKEKYIEIIQGMNEIHEFFDEKGIKWERVFLSPNYSIDSVSKTDIKDSKKFSEVTGKKKGTYGDLLDLSKELSEKRAAKNGGIDPVRETFKKQHAAKRKNRNMLKNED